MSDHNSGGKKAQKEEVIEETERLILTLIVRKYHCRGDIWADTWNMWGCESCGRQPDIWSREQEEHTFLMGHGLSKKQRGSDHASSRGRCEKVVAGLRICGSSPDQMRSWFWPERDGLFLFSEWGYCEDVRCKRKWQTDYQHITKENYTEASEVTRLTEQLGRFARAVMTMLGYTVRQKLLLVTCLTV